MVRTPPFQGENPGSNPSGAATMSRRATMCCDASTNAAQAQSAERNFKPPKRMFF